ncbi:MAG: metalloregulator ArsR/SmtB family transcription factor [Anaerococcus sp.]|nr:metalloregulator ArsR/SmtB family transcription factor [Anaerococcus sp.]
MDNKYNRLSKSLKVLSDPKRLEILDMVSCDRMCACEILEKFDISQPTLSYDMKKLEEIGLVKSFREGKKVFYIIARENFDKLIGDLKEIGLFSDSCICKRVEA